MPNNVNNLKSALTHRERKSIKRFSDAMKMASLLKLFFEKGFKSLEAIKALVNCYFPDTSQSALYDFWHLRVFDQGVFDVLENVYERLKAE